MKFCNYTRCQWIHIEIHDHLYDLATFRQFYQVRVFCSFRLQKTGDKKNTDEWMLDYALQKVVGELAPTQKGKVALLVKAFETVALAQEDTPELRLLTSKGFETICMRILNIQPLWLHNLAQHLIEDVKRRFYKNWFKSKKKAFNKYSSKYETESGK
ncbi:Calmodulin-binding protein [Artemisia annua]|uniref:Calmodulin-binding protein n=1 Tax=Artemisia annua TaxID=35608 RepID=A0A2U1NHL3_ARTAN|nr:Calmodulin-binding protein [Artemisia annua]